MQQRLELGVGIGKHNALAPAGKILKGEECHRVVPLVDLLLHGHNDSACPHTRASMNRGGIAHAHCGKLFDLSLEFHQGMPGNKEPQDRLLPGKLFCIDPGGYLVHGRVDRLRRRAVRFKQTRLSFLRARLDGLRERCRPFYVVHVCGPMRSHGIESTGLHQAFEAFLVHEAEIDAAAEVEDVEESSPLAAGAQNCLNRALPHVLDRA